MEKKKKLIILGIIALTLVIIGTTYAILTWTSSKINLGLNSGCFTIDYTKGQDISGNLKLLNESDLISNNKFTIKEGIGISAVNIGIKSTCTIEGYGSIYLNVTNISEAFTTGDSKGSLKYAVLNNNSTVTTPSSVTVSSLLNQSFDIVSSGSITSSDTITLLTKQLSNTEIYKYLVVIYVDNALAGNSITSATFQGNISADANQGKAPITTAEGQLVNLELTVSSGTPDFTKTSIDDGTNGIYSAKDDLGTSYYFRGNVTNNYVKFANKYWRIIRINGDGTIRMIYSGTSAHANGYKDSSANDMSIGTSAFNSYNDNTYVGYMYGTAGATTYANTHSNTTNSTIMTELDSWYDTNIVNTGNEKYIADAIYCNDRSVSSGTGIGTTVTTYAAQTRKNNGTPTLKCTNNNDKFTKSTTIGNGKLTKMIGQITSDEVMHAGGANSNNTEYYLYSGKWYWTMTPYSFSTSGYAGVSVVENYGRLGSNVVSNPTGGTIRPVVSLKSDAISGGSGTAASPFIVG